VNQNVKKDISPFIYDLKRKIIITGHYGSGKTELAINLAMSLASIISNDSNKTAVIDLDIVNPYFRSREKRLFLEKAGINVYGSTYRDEIGAELPALGADIKSPLEDEACNAIIDAGGNDTGALVLNQFKKYFTADDTSILAVINANRPDTNNEEKVLDHISAIENITGLKITGIVNNTHMLRETTIQDIIDGYMLCKNIAKSTGKPILCTCYPKGLIDPGDLKIPDINKQENIMNNLMPLGLYMRPTWLDK